MIFSLKYRQNELFLENIPPQMLLFRIFWYTLEEYWVDFSAKKVNFKNWFILPIVKYAVSH